MTERIGTCTSCGAQYGNIPDSLTATKVKCRKCGGVVEIPPLPGAAAAAPAAAPAAASAPPPPPPAPKPVVPPAAPPRPAAPIQKPVIPPQLAAPRAVTPPAPPSRPPVTKPPAPPAPMARPAAASLPKAPSPPGRAAEILAAAHAKREPQGPAEGSRAAAILAAARAKRSAAAAPASATAPVPAPARPHVAAASPPRPPMPPPRRGQPASRRDRHQDERMHAAPRRKSNKGLILALGSIVVIGTAAGAILWLKGVQDKQRAARAAEEAAAAKELEEKKAQQEAAAAAPAAGDAATTPASTPADGGATAPQAPADAAAPAAGQAAAGNAAADPGLTSWSPPEPGGTITYSGIKDPNVLNLALAPPLSQWSGTSDAEWTQVQENVALFVEDLGARSDRAGKWLVANGRSAYPAIVNAMLPLDFADRAQARTAQSLNHLLFDIGTGTGFGWRSLDQVDPASEDFTKAVLFNKQVTCVWYNQWVGKFSVDDAQWAGFIAREGEKNAPPAAEEKPKEKPGEKSVDDLIDG